MTKYVHAVRAVRSLRNENRRIAALPEPIRDWHRRGWVTSTGRLRKHIARNPRDRQDLRRRLMEHLQQSAAPTPAPKRRVRKKISSP